MFSDGVAGGIYKVYVQRFHGDECYLAARQRELRDIDRLAAMREIGRLDDVGRAMLCEKLEIEPADLAAFLRVMRVL